MIGHACPRRRQSADGFVDRFIYSRAMGRTLNMISVEVTTLIIAVDLD